MKQIKYISILLTVILTFGCFACGNDEEQDDPTPAVWSIVGKWQMVDEGDVIYWTFYGNGRLTVSFIDMGEQVTDELAYRLEDNTLNLKDYDGVITSYTITHTENSFTVVEDGISLTFHRVS